MLLWLVARIIAGLTLYLPYVFGENGARLGEYPRYDFRQPGRLSSGRVACFLLAAEFPG